MLYDDNPKDKPDEELGEQKEEQTEEQTEEQFSFLQETIKPKPVTRRKILMQLVRVGIYGLIFGTFACLGFFAFKPWVQGKFQGNPKTVTIPEDKEPDTKHAEKTKPEPAAAPALDVNSFKDIMKSVYGTAKEANKCVVSIQPVKEDAALSSEGSGTEDGAAGIIVADNGQELLMLCENSVCTDAKKWQATFADGSQYGVSLKKQDKNSGLAVFALSRTKIEASTWNDIEVAILGNSNLVTKGDVVIASGNMFGYADGVSYGIISSNEYQETLADGRRRILATDIPAESSGTGILFNMSGEVIGIIKPGIWNETNSNTAKAVSISDLKATIEFLVNNESVPYIGVYGTTISDEIAKAQNMPAGIYVTQVEPDSPAMSAGIQNGDILQAADGKTLANIMSYEEAVLDSRVGQTLKIKGKRRGANGYVDIDFTVVIGSKE